jgi:hypothetical protein
MLRYVNCAVTTTRRGLREMGTHVVIHAVPYVRLQNVQFRMPRSNSEKDKDDVLCWFGQRYRGGLSVPVLPFMAELGKAGWAVRCSP